MGRKIFFRFDDFPQFSAELKKFSWEDLYGKRSVDLRSFDGSSLIPVSVTFDGEHILPLSSTSLQYLDSSGFGFSSSSSLVSTDSSGVPLPLHSSVFDSGVLLSRSSTISFSDFLCLHDPLTYLLSSPDDLSSLLSFSLELFSDGLLLSFPYSYTSSPFPSLGVLLPFSGHLLVVIGHFKPPSFIGPTFLYQDLLPDADDDDGFDSDDVEFGGFW